MSVLDTKYKRKSAIITAFIAFLILWLIFNFGLTYFDPPIEYGISVNFGTTDFGSGNRQPNEALKSVKQEEITEEMRAEEIQEEVIEEETNKVTEKLPEDVITQNNEETIAIKEQEEAKKRAQDEVNAKIEKERFEREKKEAIAKEKREQEAKKKKLDALMGGLNTSGKVTGGEGDDKKQGDKGKVTGDPNASGYYGIGSSGSGGNYRLGNREALSKPKPTYDCNEEGIVYVGISVDKSGNVIAAQSGVKGTTNTAPCLLRRAKEAALKTKFNSDSNAPAKQIGLIIYEFSLSE